MGSFKITIDFDLSVDSAMLHFAAVVPKLWRSICKLSAESAVAAG